MRDLSLTSNRFKKSSFKTLGVIDVVDNGQAGLNGAKAAQFQYLLPLNENGPEKDDGGFEY